MILQDANEGTYKIAKGKKIPLVVFGESKMESGTAKKILGNKTGRSKGDKIKDAATMPVNFLFRKYHSILLENEFPLRDFTDVKKINFFDYLEWDENKIQNTIQNEIGWQVEEGMLSWRFDCKIHALVDYMHRRLFGFTEKTELYSKMIREGKITRADALARVTSGTEKR
jgi:hypothetical protein